MFICRKFSTQRHWCCILSNRVLFFFFSSHSPDSGILSGSGFVWNSNSTRGFSEGSASFHGFRRQHCLHLWGYQPDWEVQLGVQLCFPEIFRYDFLAFILSASLHPHSRVLLLSYSGRLLLTCFPFGCTSDCRTAPLNYISALSQLAFVLSSLSVLRLGGAHCSVFVEFTDFFFNCSWKKFLHGGKKLT